MVGEFVCVLCMCMHGWVNEWVSECMSEWVYEWLSERASEWVSECEWVWAQCPTPATQKRRRPRDTGRTWGRTSDPLAVHIAPRLPRKKRRSPRDTGRTWGRTSDPLAVHIAPRLLRKSSGAQGTPEGRHNIHPTPWQRTLSPHLPRKSSGAQGTPEGRQGVHPTLWQCTLSPRLPRKRDTRAYIRPLAHCPTPAAQKQRSPRDTRGKAGRTSDPLPVHIVPRLPRKSGGAQGTPEGRQGVHPTPWQCTLPPRLPRKSRGAQGTPEGRHKHTSNPLARHIAPRPPRKSSGAQGTPEGRQGVHPTLWQCTLPHACHAKAAEVKGHRRDARAYIRPLGSGHCPTPATQKQRSPRDTRGTPGRTSDPLAVHICPTPATQKQGVSEWMNEWGGGRRGADTELKTKTSHVNARKKQCFATFLPFRTPASSFFWSCLFWLVSPLTLLPSGSSHLCSFICPYCWKFGF